MRRLKADLHTHTADDPRDGISYTTEELIDSAARLGYDVLALTCHDALVYTELLAEYAGARGILLVPGVERLIEGKHVVVLNPGEGHLAARTFSDLRAVPRGDAAIIAPHPFYPTSHSLWGALKANIDVFDAVEYCSLYCWGLNPNRRAARVARACGLPMVGTSDVHKFPYTDTTFTWVESIPTVTGITEAIRRGRVQVNTRPRSTLIAAQAVFNAARGVL